MLAAAETHAEAIRRLEAGIPSAKRRAKTTPASSRRPGSGVPWKWVAIAAGVAGALYLFQQSRRSSRRTYRNPDSVVAAEKMYRGFHWGRDSRRKSRVSVSDIPNYLVKLGTIEAITYSARKGGRKLADYIHHFGEGGGRKPALAADPKSKRLHVVGGTYDVRPEGITG